MSNQLLINVITATVPAYSGGTVVPHGLRSNGKPVAPTLILPKEQSAVTIASVDAINVYLANPSDSDVTVTLRCERGLSMEVDADTVTPFFMSTGDGETGVTSVAVTAPITNSGTATAPNIGMNTSLGGILYGTYPNPSKLASPTMLLEIEPGTQLSGTSLYLRPTTKTSAGIGPQFILASGDVTDGQGSSIWLKASNGAGTNKGGGTVVIRGGDPTGTGTGGYVSIASGACTASSTPYVSVGTATTEDSHRSWVNLGLDNNRKGNQFIRINGTPTLGATGVSVVISAASDTIPLIRGPFIQMVGGFSGTLTSTPTIAIPTWYAGLPDVAFGAMIVLMNDMAAGRTVTLQKDAALGGPLAGSKLALRSNTLSIGYKEAYDFIFDGTYWVQRG